MQVRVFDAAAQECLTTLRSLLDRCGSSRYARSVVRGKWVSTFRSEDSARGKALPFQQALAGHAPYRERHHQADSPRGDCEFLDAETMVGLGHIGEVVDE